MTVDIETHTKVADQVLARIFDQRQFTNGEINYMVREFGDVTDLEGNFDKVLKMNETVCMITDKYNEDMCSSCDHIMTNINAEGK